ncbi:hypothetical protein [Helicobacter sp. CLO-3]|uniref:hypothetical protein n=1 Tax=Helicobacter sp. CLO-3 TaxID=211 RepID=UPI00115FACDF|nr:hypothetical protein [Helicobacter sp. CLO-3]
MQNRIKQDSKMDSKIRSKISSRISKIFLRIPLRFRAYCRICLLVLCLNSPTFADEDMKTRASMSQFFSLHIGSSTDFGLPHTGIDTQTGINVGLSLGVSYLSFANEPFRNPYVDFGMRFRYLYSDTFTKTHSVGAVFYIHPFQNYKTPFPLSYEHEPQGYVSLVFGGGVLFSSANVPNLNPNYRYYFNGGYVEAGVGLLRLFPFANVDVLYRASFYGESAREVGVDSIVHGIYVVFNIL